MTDALILPHKRALVLDTADRQRIVQTFPKCADLNISGKQFVAVPHTLDSEKLLSNMNVPVTWQSPYRQYYNPPLIRGLHPARDYQHVTAEFICRERRGFVLHPPRMGKTAASLLAVDYIRQERGYSTGKGAALIVAPRTSLEDVWEREILGLRPESKCAVLTGSKKRRLKLLAEDSDIYLINPDGIKVIADDLMQAVKDKRISLLVIDEITDYASAGSDRFKAVKPIADLCEWAIGMSGTLSEPDHVYSAVKLIRPENVPFPYSTWQAMTMVNVGPPGTVILKPRATAKDDIERVMTPAIRFEKEILGLAKVIKEHRRAPMSPQQKRAYEAIRRDAMILSEDGEQKVSAANAGVLMQKMLQIALGLVRDENGGVMEFDTSPRLAVLDEEVEKSETKVVLFTPYRAVNRALEQHLSKYGCVRVDGDVTGKKRAETLETWRKSDDIKCLILHPKTGAYGLELAQADTLIFYGPPLNGTVIYQQAAERINSSVQKSLTPTVVSLSASPVEDRLFAALEQGADWNKEINALFSQVIRDEG